MTVKALQVVNLQAKYPRGQVLHGVSLYAMAGEVIALLGRNGSGRRTMLRAISGHSSDICSGSVRIIGREALHDPSPDISQLGVSTPLSGSIVDTDLTCEENLLMPTGHHASLGGGLSLARIYALCPTLHDLRLRPASELNQGEERLVALGRLLRSGANVLLLNAFTPGAETHIVAAFISLIRALSDLDYTIIVSDPDLAVSQRIAHRFYVLDAGHLVDRFDDTELPSRRQWLNRLLMHDGLPANGAGYSPNTPVQVDTVSF